LKSVFSFVKAFTPDLPVVQERKLEEGVQEDVSTNEETKKRVVESEQGIVCFYN
jgi:hypothetical protein